jgi:uncharacterized protein DUF3376/patatin-like phospholipase
VIPVRSGSRLPACGQGRDCGEEEQRDGGEPEPERTQPGQPIKEIRLALVCYGGVSLAIYMHGVTKEIHKLLLASQAFGQDQENNPFDPGSTQHLYWERLRELNDRDQVRTRVVVDIVAGTSAGGINGVYLAKAIAHNASQDALRNLWFEHGDIGELLRFPRRLPTRLRFALFGLQAMTHPLGVKPPLRGDEMCRLLYDALAEMDGTSTGVDGTTLVPRDESVELLVTLTDLKGHRRYIPISDRVVHDRTHRHVMRFCFDHQVDQFGDGHNGPLAFAARATFSFPGAFPPLSSGEFQAALPGRQFEPATLETEFSRHTPSGARPWPTASSSTAGCWTTSRSGTRSTRSCASVPPPRSSGGWCTSSPPRGTAAAGIWPCAAGRPAAGVAGDDLERDLRDPHARADPGRPHAAPRLQRARQPRGRPDRGQLRGGPRRAGAARRELLAGEPPTAEAVGERMAAVHDRARTRAGAAYLGYVQLKLQVVSRWLADLVAASFAYPPESSHASFVRAVMHEWMQYHHRIRPGDRELERQIDFLDRYDIPYRERRLRFVIRGINDLYAPRPADPAEGSGEPQGASPEARAALDQAKAELYDFLDRLRDASDPAKVRAAVGDPPFHVLNAEQLAAWVDADRLPDEFLEEHREALDQLVDRIGEILRERLDGFSADLWTRFSEATRDWEPATRVGLVVRYVGFPLWDTLLFPIMDLSDIWQLNQITVKRISPDDAKRLPVPPEEKLQGVALHHFGAFFKRSAREHDYLWGRLDAVEQRLGLLDPKLPNTVYRQAFDQVFAEERQLGATRGLRERLEDALQELSSKLA